jgi:leader peptidase (prepilin peptidase)/N-methyltransferase
MTKGWTILAFFGALLFALLGLLHHATDLTLSRLALLGAALAAVSAIDLREHRIPNRIVLPAATTCALIAGPKTLLQSLPALGLVGILLALAVVQPEALGMGDVKEALLIAVALGAAATSALLLGLAFAALAAVALVINHGRRAFARALPLAPFLAAGTTLMLAFK